MHPSDGLTLSNEFERQVKRHPGRIAVRAHDGQLTYGDLNRRADGIGAALLETLGPGLEPVAVLMEQGCAFMASILGVLKAGKPFSPLDPVYPRLRLAHMLKDLGARVVLADPAQLAAAASFAGPDLEAVNVEQIGPLSGEAGTGVTPSPDDLAWIIYTSGSTGRPKGVAQKHRNAVRMTRDYTKLAGITEQDRLTLLHPALTWDIFGALLSGAGLFPYDLRRRGVAPVGEWLAEEGITLYRSFPTTYRQVVDSLGDTRFPNIRLVHLSGEIITRKDVELYRKHFNSGCRLVVVFGSSEAGFMTAQEIRHDTAIEGDVPIGQAFDDVEIRLYDDNRRLLGLDEIGEIAVRSPHVFPGYWRRPDLTEAAFLTEPGDLGGSFYLTGDLGRMRPDGTFFYAGRKDFQVKVRGYRIELAEVETALLALESVRESAATVFDDETGGKRIVAYVVPYEGHQPTSDELRSALSGALPQAMIPSVFVTLDKLPLTPNGKLDRGALPPPGRSRPDLTAAFVPPRNEIERNLARIWREVLQLNEVGVEDPFLHLGGDSLQAMQIVTRAKRALSIEMSLGALLSAATIAEMAADIAGALPALSEND